jgi:Protein of unknown function (DUF3575).
MKKTFLLMLLLSLLTVVGRAEIKLRTNLLCDAFLLPTLGVEWRITPEWGVKADGCFSHWGSETGNVQKTWLINPEVRFYMDNAKCFYSGVGGSYGRYNIHGFPLSKFLSQETGYQGALWNAGITVGYQLKLTRSFSLDFNLGLGYMCFEYDSFKMVDQVRVYKDKKQTKNYWGPMQAGVTLVWKIMK